MDGNSFLEGCKLQIPRPPPVEKVLHDCMQSLKEKIDHPMPKPLQQARALFQELVQNGQEKQRELAHLLKKFDPLAAVGSALQQHLRSQPRGPLMLASLSSSLHEGASVDKDVVIPEAKHLMTLAMSTEQVASKLAGVSVWTVSNAYNEFVLITDLEANKSLGLLCFRQSDAESLLKQVKDRDPKVGKGAKVVPVDLDQVYKLKAEGIAFRFLPDPKQVKNALEERAKVGDVSKGFDGIPVFQSANLVLRYKGRAFCPVFFSKEDLETALGKAFKKQQRTNPAMKVSTDVQVGSFEAVLQTMESIEADSSWDKILFVPPGQDTILDLEASFAGSFQGSTVIAQGQDKRRPTGPTVTC
eukprot:jgi/Mesen1/10252/ME000774S09572